MALTTLDPKTALIVIDLQKGIVGYPTVHPIKDILDANRALLDAFRRHRLPVVLVNVDGVPPGRTEQGRRLGTLPPDWTELVPELNQQPSDHVVTKRTRGAFTHTDLNAYLQQQGVTQVIVTGVATSAGVESTVRHAHELGFNVTVALDAMTDMDADTHNHSATRVFPKISETGSTREIIALLDSTRA